VSANDNAPQQAAHQSGALIDQQQQQRQQQQQQQRQQPYLGENLQPEPGSLLGACLCVGLPGTVYI